jgi:hypothetical protein
MQIQHAVSRMVPALKRRGDLGGVAGPGGKDIFLTQRGGTTALADWSSTDVDLRQAQVQHSAWFAVHMMSSMSLAGLDRSYGTLSEETDRVLRASETEPESPNVVVDFALMHKLRECDTSTLQLEADSGAMRLAAVSAAVLQSNIDVVRAFLVSKKHAPTPAFEAVLGVTDPDERLRRIGKRIGKTDRIVTASLQTYLCLTLCDPYAYGISPSRAVHSFLASMLVRAKIRNDGKVDEAEWPLTELDRQIMLAPEITNIADDSADEQMVAAARTALRRMPAFEGYMQCALQHRAGEAHKNNPHFHAMYTILKATYIVHFAVGWLQHALLRQLDGEGKETVPTAKQTSPKILLAPDSARVLEARIEELRRVVEAAAKGNMQESARANAYRTVVRCANIVKRESERAVLDDSLAFAKLVLGDGAPNKGAQQPIDDAYAKYQNDEELQPPAPVAWHYARELALPRTHQRHNAETMSMQLAVEITESVKDVKIGELAAAVRNYAIALVLAQKAEAAPDAAAPSAVRMRMYVFRSPLLFLSRTYALLHRIYASTGASAQPKVPVIVTMIREAGWGQKDAVTNMRYTEAFAKQFSSFTLAMAHGVLYCHDTMGDVTRGATFGTYLQQLREKNLTLMAMVQRRVLETTPACHPFRHAAATQLTLPVAVVAEMLPSDRILPLDWTMTKILEQAPGEEGSIRAVLGDETFTRLKQEDTATLNLLAKISGSSKMSQTRTAMQAVAFSNLRA